jgi:predicted aspartyl protease
MAQLSFPIISDGLVVDVMVNVKASILIPLRLSGGGPSPLAGRALIDTGSDITAVSRPILHQLGIPKVLPTSTRGIGGSVSVDLYEVSFHILDGRNVLLPWLSYATLVVMELDPTIPFDALIGMDILRTCKLLIDGPANQFTLDF